MNIQQLRYVVATAEQGSMTAAATSLYVAQPALSRAIRLLERELGITLFQRAGRGVALTTDGADFVARARRVLRSVEALRQHGPDDDDGDRGGPLVIAASPTLQASLALPILSELRDQGVAFSARLVGCGSSREVHDLVVAGRADLGLCDHTVASDLEVVPLGVAEVTLVSPGGLDLPDPIEVRHLAGVPLVLPTTGSDRRAALDWFFEMVGVTPTVAVESDERNVWLEAVRRGLASCIWHSTDRLRLPAAEVAVRRFDPPMHQQLTAVHRGESSTPDTMRLLETLRRFAELTSTEPA